MKKLLSSAFQCAFTGAPVKVFIARTGLMFGVAYICGSAACLFGVLAGCKPNGEASLSGDLTARANIAKTMGTDDCFRCQYGDECQWMFVARDTNGTIWFYKTWNSGEVRDRQKIFDPVLK